MSPRDPSAELINRKAGCQSPDSKRRGGAPRDVSQADKARAAGGPGPSFFARQHDICERLRREVVWEPEVGQLLNEAADEITRLRLVVSRIAKCDTPQANHTPSEGSVHGWCTLTAPEREAISYYVGTGGPDTVDATLAALLDRTKTGGK